MYPYSSIYDLISVTVLSSFYYKNDAVYLLVIDSLFKSHAQRVLPILFGFPILSEIGYVKLVFLSVSRDRDSNELIINASYTCIS